ncbi:MAG TPA: peptidylprolyl isomerase [Chromatiales bacterium]|nr:peptidylprolyl isomerase [Chromatiales bacterium]
MMHFIREHAKGFFAWLIVILIIIPFAFWGINSYFDGGSADSVVARVNEVEITAREFQRVYVRERARRQEMLGENADPALLNDALIKRDVIDRLVNSESVAQAAIDAGLRVGDTQLAREIIQNPQFQQDGRFDGELYARILNSMGLTEKGFEAEVRQDMLVEQLISGVTGSEFATARELQEVAALVDQERDIAYLTLSPGDFSGEAVPADEEIEAYYEENKDLFSLPEQVSVEYLELSAADLMDGIEVDEDALRRMYEEQEANFVQAEERRASHILITVDPDADEAADQAARDKALQLLERIRSGESFEEIAKAESQDPGSAAEGGDLGFFGRGMMVKPFEEAVYGMSIGDISEPVRTRFGYHIIKLTDIKAQQGRPFEEVRAALEQEYRELVAEDRFYDIAEQLSDLTYEIPDTLEVAAQELDLEIKTSPLFSRHVGEGIASNPKVRAMAFSPDVLEAGNNSEPVTIGTNHVVVLRIKDRRSTSHKPLEDVRDEIIASLQRETSAEKARALGEKIRERMAAGEDPASLAEEYQVEWREAGFVRRDDSGVPGEVLRAAFRMMPPGQDQARIEGVELVSGGYAVVALKAVRDSAVAEGNGEDTEERFKNLVLRKYGAQAGNGVLESIRKRSKIEIIQENL